MIQLRTLGALDLRKPDDSEVRSILAQPRRAALLVYLAVATPFGFHRRDRLLALFWPESDEGRARASLSRAIYFLRRELGDGLIVSRGDDEIGLSVEHFWCDAAAFDKALRNGQSDKALELYRGDLLPDFFATNAKGFEDWLENERARFRDRASEAAWTLAADAEAEGNLPLAVRWARSGVELAPFREVGLRRLLALLDRAGDRAEAAHAYGHFADQIAAELELAPSPETRALIDAIRTRELVNTAADHIDARNELLHGPVDSFDARNGRPREAVHPAFHPTSESPAPLAAARAPRPWGLFVGALAVVVAVAVTMAVLSGPKTPSLPRVYVAPFVNRTGDPAFEALGRVAADRVIESLVSTGLVEVVEPNTVGSSRARETAAAGPSTVDVTGIGRRAGTAVVGELHREAGRIHVQAWITDTRRGQVVWAIRPVSAAADSVQRAIDEVRQRATGAVAALTMRRFASWFPVASSAPTFEAFQEFAHGVDLQLRGENQDALKYLRRAVVLDTTFVWAELQLALAHLNLFESEQADSIAERLNHTREHLMPLQRHWLDWMLAMRSEDALRCYRAISAAAELAPERFLFTVAQWATRLNRPRETIQVLTRLGPDGPYNYEDAYWGLLTRAYHALGEYERELAAAREARRRYPERVDVVSFEISALAALGRILEAQELLDTALALPQGRPASPARVVDMPLEGFRPGKLIIAAAEEFRAHGYPEAATAALARAIAWYKEHPGADEAHRYELGRAMYLARDWVAAEAVFRSLATADTSNFVYVGYLGTIAARRGDSLTARRIIAKFDTLRKTLARPHAEAAYWQSRISVLLGDDARGMTLLAESAGPQGHGGLHRDFDFERIWDTKTFREFIRPKG
jgi:DNA-binding SARP family transcriptional activator/TolB-like protein